jgi:septal ring factor EnvC (AmiA/AmiB activator)
LAASTTASEVKSLPARESLRRTSEALQSQIEQANNKLEELRLSERYAAQTKRDLRGNKTTPQAVAKSIVAVESTIRDLSTNLSDVSTRIDTVDQDTSVPTFEKVGVPSGKALLPIADVPVEQTAQVVQALEPQIQAQNLALESNKNELKNVGFQIRKILTAAKKAPLNNMQQDRLSKLQKRQSNLKALVLNAESKPRTAEAVIANARSEAARKAQEDAARAKRLADMQAAADARAAADEVERLAAAAKTNRPENPTPFSTPFTNAQVPCCRHSVSD